LVVAILSIWNVQAATAKYMLGEKVDTTVLSSMLSQSSYRKSFIESSIKECSKAIWISRYRFVLALA